MRTFERRLMIVVIVVVLPLCGLSLNQDNSEVRKYVDTFKLYDDEFLSGFYLKINADVPHSLRQEGRYSSEIEITGSGIASALKTVSVDFGDLGGIKKGSLSEQGDGDGFKSTFNAERYIILDAKRKTVRTDTVKIGIDSGKVVSRKRQRPRIDKYPLKNGDAESLLFRHVLALGRGYSRRISRYDKAALQSDGSLRIEGQGTLFSPHRGQWVLDIDPENGYLVRKATFTYLGQDTPFLISETKGLGEARIGIAESGSYNLGDYKISVKLLDFKKAVDESVIDDVKKAVSLRPPQAFIMDFNLVNSDGMPLVLTKDPLSDKAIVKAIKDLKIEPSSKKPIPSTPATTVKDNANEPPANSTAPIAVNEVDSAGKSNSHVWVFVAVGLCAVICTAFVYIRRKQ